MTALLILILIFVAAFQLILFLEVVKLSFQTDQKSKLTFNLIASIVVYSIVLYAIISKIIDLCAWD